MLMEFQQKSNLETKVGPGLCILFKKTWSNGIAFLMIEEKERILNL